MLARLVLRQRGARKRIFWHAKSEALVQVLPLASWSCSKAAILHFYAQRLK
jgi:hypothetical protein